MKKFFALLLMLALLLSLAACGGSETPVSGGSETPTGGEAPAQQPAAGPAGTWTLSESGDPEYAPGQITLLLDEDGFGYQAITDFSDDYAYQDYLELRWSEGAIILDGVGGVYLLQGDSLTFTWEGVTSTYVRSGTVSAPLTPPAGSYTSYMVLEEGEEYPDDSFALTLNADGTGSYFGHGEELPMTWNRYFITLDGNQSFYYVYGYYGNFDICIFDGEYQIVLRPAQN